MSQFVISRVDPAAGDVMELLRQHWRFTAEVTPPEYVHALDLKGLLDPSVVLYGLREGDHLLGIGALKSIDSGHVEIKSMHTAATARGRGVAGSLLSHLLGVARQNGARRVSLETGRQAAFQPAISLYARAGFALCGPFGTYSANPNSVFMTLRLD